MRSNTFIVAVCVGLGLGAAALAILRPLPPSENAQVQQTLQAVGREQTQKEVTIREEAARIKDTGEETPSHADPQQVGSQSPSTRAGSLATRFYKAMHTFGGENDRQALMEAIHLDPSLHEEALKSLSDLDHALREYGEDQAAARALFGKYLQHLAKKGHRQEIERLMSAVSRDLTSRGDRKGRRLDLEDAVLAWIDAVGNEAVIQSPETTVGRLSLATEGWGVAKLALSNRIPELWESAELRDQVKAAINNGVVQ